MSAVETKSAGGDILADLNRAFSAFKETNDERLTQLESRLCADVVTEEKLLRIDQALDDTKSRLDRLALEMSRPRIGGEEHLARREAPAGVVIDFMRRGRLDSDAWEARDIPLGEASESYEADISLPMSGKRTLAAATTSLLYPAAEELADFGAPQSELTLAICQLSAAVGRGFPLTTTLAVQ